ncbi:MAG: SCP2 sterol-binding domain-containing protein [Gammaproteobacteria bacterium]|nr:sterol-binding protein [Gammaproteobacteria bacterium]
MRLPLSAAAERLLERAVRESSSVERKLEALEGRSFRVRVEGVGLDLTLRAEGGRVRVIENDAAPSDVTVRGTPLDLLRLVRQRNIASRLHGSGVELTGRVHVAEQFAEVLKLALPDLEEEAARFVGDIPAHRAGQAARAFVAWLKRSGRAFELNTAEYLTEERRLLPTRYEAEALLDAVETLRDDVERAAARLERLERRLRGRRQGSARADDDARDPRRAVGGETR